MLIDKIKIGDCLVHPIHGTVSFQPIIGVEYHDLIPVRRVKNFKQQIFIRVLECRKATEEESGVYWRDKK